MLHKHHNEIYIPATSVLVVVVIGGVGVVDAFVPERDF